MEEMISNVGQRLLGTLAILYVAGFPVIIALVAFGNIFDSNRRSSDQPEDGQRPS